MDNSMTIPQLPLEQARTICLLNFARLDNKPTVGIVRDLSSLRRGPQLTRVEHRGAACGLGALLKSDSWKRKQSGICASAYIPATITDWAASRRRSSPEFLEQDATISGACNNTLTAETGKTGKHRNTYRRRREVESPELVIHRRTFRS